MLTKPLILNTAVFQESFGPAFEQCRLLPAKREGFRKLTKQIAQTVMVFRRPLNKRPTRKILDVHKQHLRFADKQEKANCLINEILYLDLIEKLPKHLHWINSAERVIWLASVADEPSRDDLYPNHMKQVGYCEVADGRLAIEWARGIIERDFVGDYKAWRRLKVMRHVLSGSYGFFPTPATVAQTVYTFIPNILEDGDTFLEPSAGTGDLALETIELYKQRDGLNIFADCIEWNASLYDILCEQTTNITPRRRNFLEYVPDRDYKLVLMNPPFDSLLAHVTRAYKWIVPDGALVSIVPKGFDKSYQKPARKFLKMARRNGVEFYDLPKDSFAISGTNVQTAVMVLQKGEFD